MSRFIFRLYGNQLNNFTFKKGIRNLEKKTTKKDKRCRYGKNKHLLNLLILFKLGLRSEDSY